MATTPGWSARASCQWPRGELNPQHPSTSVRVVCRLPTGPHRPPRCQRPIRQSARRESNPPVRLGGPVPGPLGHGHFACSGRRGSRTLKARRSSGFRPGAVASRLALPFSVWMAGFEPAWSGTRGRRMKPCSPTSSSFRVSFASTPSRPAPPPSGSPRPRIFFRGRRGSDPPRVADERRGGPDLRACGRLPSPARFR